MAAETVLKASLDDVRKTELARDAEKARKSQEMLRKQAPRGVRVGSAYADPMIAIMERLVPDALGKNPKTSTFTSPPESHGQRISEGWEPVVEDGQHVRRGADLVYKRPIEFTQAALKEVSDRSRARLKAFDKQFADAKKEGIVTPDSEVAVTKGADGPGS